MSIFSYRQYLRFLSRAQRRRWWEQKKTLKPRVAIGRTYLPHNIARQFTYIKFG